MLIHSVIIFFQEVFEAALLAGLLMAVGKQHRLPKAWLWRALVLGIACASLYAINIGNISEWFDYVGQELVNALLQCGIFFCILALLFLDQLPEKNKLKNWMCHIMMLAITLAMTMEGSEIVIYLSGAIYQSDGLLSLFTGAVLGSAIGASFAALIYYALVRYPGLYATLLTRILLTLGASAMLSQGCQQLVQADWLPGVVTVWDSSALIDEKSLLGHFLYAMFGYEATPNLTQLTSYLCGFAAGILIILYRFLPFLSTRRGHA